MKTNEGNSKDRLSDFERRREEALKRHSRRLSEDVDRHLRRTERWTYVGVVISLLVWLVAAMFVVWVVVGVLNHFGITDVPLPGLT